MTLQVRYYAVMREQRGLSEEVRNTAAPTPADLYEELRQEFRFTLPPEALKFAVNDEFVGGTHALAEGDLVTFIPPVAGG